jgi:hypothetical protein
MLAEPGTDRVAVGRAGMSRPVSPLDVLGDPREVLGVGRQVPQALPGEQPDRRDAVSAEELVLVVADNHHDVRGGLLQAPGQRPDCCLGAIELVLPDRGLQLADQPWVGVGQQVVVAVVAAVAAEQLGVALVAGSMLLPELRRRAHLGRVRRGQPQHYLSHFCSSARAVTAVLPRRRPGVWRRSGHPEPGLPLRQQRDASPARINALVSLHQNRNETISASEGCLIEILLYRICAVNGDIHRSSSSMIVAIPRSQMT